MGLKPWPWDVVIITCTWPAWIDRKRMLMPARMECRDCGRNVVVDHYAIAEALQWPLRCGRPVVLLCPACFRGYDYEQTGELGRVV